MYFRIILDVEIHIQLSNGALIILSISYSGKGGQNPPYINISLWSKY